tara:strand:+ start:560 stop:2530 length:1971 start_codon:yes stop_codon:yes gene_type:complete
MPVQNFSGLSSLANEGYKFGGTFAMGTTPTLLDNTEARRVKWFIENMVFRSAFEINVGTPATNQFLADFSNGEAVKWRLDLQTALRYDREPRLGANLDLRGHDILFRELSRLVQWGANGFQFHPQNYPADTADNLRVILKLFAWDSETPYHVGFKTASASDLAGSGSLDSDDGLVWTLPHEDGTSGQVLQTDGSRVLSFVDGGSGQNFGIISVAGQSDVEADQSKDTLTLIAGTGISLTTDAAADSVTITNTDYGGGSLTVKEQDGTPSVSNVTTIKFDNGTVTDDGSGVVSVTNSGGGSDFPLTGNQNEIVTIDATGDPIVSTDIKSTGGSGNLADKYLTFVDLKNSVDYFFGRKTDSHADCEGLGVTTSESNKPVAEFYDSASTIGSYRTLSIGHSQHQINGSDQAAYNINNALDVHGSITIRPASVDPQSDDNQFGQIVNEQTNNAGKIYMPKNTYNVTNRTQAIVWKVDPDTTNDEITWHQVIRAGGELSNISINASSGLHVVADTGDSMSTAQDGQVFLYTGGTDIETTLTDTSTSGSYISKTARVAFDYTGGTSDARLKKNIEPLKGAAEKVAALRAVEFDWSDEKQIKRTGNVHDFGFVAQEVEKVCPELVREKSDGIKTVEYGHVVPLLLDVIQDLTKRIEVLEAKAQ